jgi:hypothetical protein
MTPETHELLLTRTRSELREVSEAFTLLERVSTSDSDNARLMQEVADKCSPRMRTQQLFRLCDEIEMILDGRVTGWLKNSVKPQVLDLEAALSNLSSTTLHLSQNLSRYAGIIGYIRAVADLKQGVVEFFAPARLHDELGSSMTRFGDALISLICSLEGAISHHTGELFRYNRDQQSE